MTVIYEPRGAAREYAPLAANLYRGCGHGCRYCYAPACIRTAAADFHAHPAPRPGVLDALRREAARLPAGAGPVLLCFTCDPYQPIEAEHHLTRQALEILGGAGVSVRLLTKNPALAMADLALVVPDRVEFGVSLSWATDARRQEWEPAAGTVAERIHGLAVARAVGLATWVSMEPVIDPAEALAALRLVSGHVDMVKVGKLNHDAAREALIDWPAFAAEAVAIMRERGQAYYLKHDLWRLCVGRVEGGQSWSS
ncbi:MAG: hypothetical protein IMZ66_11810 [Planctomycetes bacterium]|nr:hypothetical protein [Planctomycetota bacterium]